MIYVETIYLNCYKIIQNNLVKTSVSVRILKRSLFCSINLKNSKFTIYIPTK